MKNNVKLSPLAAAVLLATSSMASSQTQPTSDEASSEQMEEVVVTGIRGSLQRARDVKRSADSIMDAISAEDIGKFPDSNIAESLQRITGVTISRDRGQGQKITVRGMGPEYNAVTLNGRTLATDNLGRELNFDVVAAELISAAEIIKSPTASLQEGSIGAAVNIRTRRPMELEDGTLMGSIKTTYNDLSEEYSPKFSALASSTFFDGRFGALVSIAYTKEEHRSDFLGISDREYVDTDGDGNEDAWTPNQINSRVVTGERERLGGTFGLEFQPNDQWHMVLDGLYSKFRTDENRGGYYVHFNNGKGGEAYTADNNIVVDKDRNVVSITSSNEVVELVKEYKARYTDTYQVGFNVEFQPTEQFIFTTDLAYSSSEWDERGDGSFFAAIGTNTADTQYDQNGDIPTVSTNVDPFDPSIYRANWSNKPANVSIDDVYSFNFDGKWIIEKGVLDSLQSGFAYTDREKDFTFFGSANGCSACGYQLDIPDEVVGGVYGEGFLSDESGNFLRSIPDFDQDALFAYLETVYPGSYNTIVEHKGNASNIQEETTAFFIQANFTGMMGSLPWSGNFGVRYVETEQTTAGQTSNVVSFGSEVQPGDPACAINNGDNANLCTEFASFENNYEDTLPSANFKLNFTDNLTLRLGAARVMTRPTLGKLKTGLNIDAREDKWTISAGNPFLEPYRADQYDAALEWYPEPETGIVFGYFRKELDSFVTAITQTEYVLGVEFDATRQRNGKGGTVDGFEAAVSHTFINLPYPYNGLGFQANYTFVDSTSQFASEISTEKFQVEGLSSDSYNLILFYDQGPLQARVAYNFRGDYLDRAIGQQSEPEYIDDYGQVDFSASYDLTDNLALTFDGSNLTNERTLKYQRIRSRVREIEYNGRLLSLGLRATF
jgi:iron complex outermembrane recepter protein